MHEIIIENWHPTRLNQLLGCYHWSQANRLKKADAKMLAAYSRHVEKAAGKRRVTLTITMAPKMRCADVDAFWKSLLDGLVRNHLLIDDSPKWCEIMPVVYERGPVKKTTIRLYDCAN